jgi:mycofactocin biosynthesis protein MftB
VTVTLDAAFALSDQVAVRPEPFGALVYHYGNRRLVFLRKPELVDVVRALGEHESVEAALDAAAIDRRRWPSFVTALASLEDAEVIRAR